MKTLLFFLLSIPLYAYSQTENLSVLFIGNSFMNVNNVPQMEANLLKSTGIHAYIDSRLVNGQSMDFFIQDSTCWSKIRSRQWDYIVLQDYQGFYYDTLGKLDSIGQPIPLLANNLKIQDSIKKLNPCVKIIYFAGWEQKGGLPSRFPGDNTTKLITRILANYTYLNNLPGVHNVLAPVGVAWLKSIAQNPKLDLYSSDDRHPSVAGSFLTACVLYSTIFERSPADTNNKSIFLDRKTDSSLKAIAYQAVMDSFNYSNLRSVAPEIDSEKNVISTDKTYQTFQWYQDTTAIAGAKENNYTVSNFEKHYWVETTDKNGCKYRSFAVKISKHLGIDEPLAQVNFTIAPNPARSHFVIQYHTSGNLQADVSIYNLMGQMVSSTVLPSGPDALHTEEIKTGSLSPGCYIVKFGYGDNHTVQKLIIE